MKRMNEVFELPIPQGAAYAYGFATIREAAKIGRCPAAKHAAIAINNVDKLADALEFLLGLPRGCSGRIIIEKSEETVAIAALKAYRGEK